MRSMRTHRSTIAVALIISAAFAGRTAASAQPREARLLRLTFAGDLMAHRPINAMTDYGIALKDLTPSLQNADLAFVNVEFVVDPSRPLTGYPNFNGSIDYVRAAIGAGFDLFALANNHTMDYRTAGAAATNASFADLAREHGIGYSGLGIAVAGSWREHRFPPPVIRTVRGVRVGFVSVSQFSNLFWTDVYRQMVLVDAGNRADFLRYLQSVDQEVDVLVVSYHGDADDEYHLHVGAGKRRVMESFTAAGADIVWGHHPHVIQEWSYPVVAGARKLVLFSTGNLLSSQGSRLHRTDPDPENVWANTHDGYLFHVTVKIVPGAATVTALETEPIFQRRLASGSAATVVQPFAALMNSERRSGWRSYYLSRNEYLRERAARIDDAARSQAVVP